MDQEIKGFKSDLAMKFIEKFGLPGLVIVALSLVIWVYMLPAFQQIADSNVKANKSLEEVSINMAKMNEELPEQMDQIKKEIIQEFKYYQTNKRDSK